VFSAVFDIQHDMEKQEHVVCSAPHVIPDDDEDTIKHDNLSHDSISRTIQTSEQNFDQLTYKKMREENISDFMTEVPTIQPNHNVIEDDEGRLAGESKQAELLRWHYCLGHLSFAKIRLLAMLQILPCKLAGVKPPRCAGCIYGSMTKQPWRTKSTQNKSTLRTVTTPGECVSIDQLESQLPGFIAQMKGRLIRQRYRAATIFVDHAS
jgi:hypothetical protein